MRPVRRIRSSTCAPSSATAPAPCPVTSCERCVIGRRQAVSCEASSPARGEPASLSHGATDIRGAPFRRRVSERDRGWVAVLTQPEKGRSPDGLLGGGADRGGRALLRTECGIGQTGGRQGSPGDAGRVQAVPETVDAQIPVSTNAADDYVASISAGCPNVLGPLTSDYGGQLRRGHRPRKRGRARRRASQRTCQIGRRWPSSATRCRGCRGRAGARDSS